MSFILLAQSRLDAMHHAFASPRSSDGYQSLILLAAILVTIAVIAGWLYLFKAYESRKFNNSQALFLELCRTHHIRRGQAKLLSELASLLNFPSPTVLMLDSSLWQLDSQVVQTGLTPAKLEKLAKIQAMLF